MNPNAWLTKPKEKQENHFPGSTTESLIQRGRVKRRFVSKRRKNSIFIIFLEILRNLRRIIFVTYVLIVISEK